MTEEQTAKKGWCFPSALLGGLLVITGLLLYGFWDGITYMWRVWGGKEEYGYAYFIPFISAYLIWQRRNRLIETEFHPSWMGVVVVLVAGVLLFLGQASTTYTLQQYALVLCILGIALALMGWRAFKLVLGPLFLLFFIVPLPVFIYNNLSTYLQLISSELGVAVIRLFGISVYLEGNIIDLGSYKLQVVEACSGLRYLFPLASLAFLMAYLFKVELWKRVLVFLSSIPITVFMNSFRLGVIGVLVDRWGTEQAEGFLHYFEGWVIFMACFAILLLEMALLTKIGKKRRFQAVFGLEMPEPLPENMVREPRLVTPVHYSLIASAILIALSSFYIQVRDEVIPERTAFINFPEQIGEWQGKDDKLEAIYVDSLKLDDYILADYTNKAGDKVNFYVAYYGSQQAGSSAHSPRSCIPGGGWQISEMNARQLDGINVAGHPLVVNRLVIKRGDYKQLVYYWFQQRGRVISNEYLTKWFLFWDGMTRHRTDGAMVRVVTTMGPRDSLEKGDERLEQFVRQAVLLLGEYVPE